MIEQPPVRRPGESRLTADHEQPSPGAAAPGPDSQPLAPQPGRSTAWSKGTRVPPGRSRPGKHVRNLAVAAIVLNELRGLAVVAAVGPAVLHGVWKAVSL